jgi:hypothetical protein
MGVSVVAVTVPVDTVEVFGRHADDVEGSLVVVVEV